MRQKLDLDHSLSGLVVGAKWMELRGFLKGQ